ncbi:MAG: F0F1 ATP synthase subunit delta [Verrucomicrobiae bacterium]|nr:F0F1 ATP synthase subunit delta [Verrucomicrobiae bacterium]
MKISKDARRTARQLLKATLKDGRVDGDVVRKVVASLKKNESRGFLGVLSAYARLVRIEIQRSHATIESAVALDEATRGPVEADLQKKHGGGLTVEYKVTPELLGGLRIQVGNDVWDGSVKGRLERLRDRIG